jgi:V-type H+-transporting ATPase subunit D
MVQPSAKQGHISNQFQVANKKQRDTAAADAEMKARREAEAAAQGGQTPQKNDDTHTDVLGENDDDDVIF